MQLLFKIRKANINIRDKSLLRYLVRPVGNYTAWFALKCKLTPNNISYFNLIVSICICIGFAVGNTQTRVMTSLMLLIWQIIDVTDGTMARTLNTRSNFGGFIDDLGGLIIIAFLPICVGINLFTEPEYIFKNILKGTMSNDITYKDSIFFMCATNSIISVTSRLFDKMLKIRFEKHLNVKQNSVFKTTHFMLAIKNLENLGGLQIILLIISSIFQCLELYVIIYFTIYITMLPLLIVIKSYTMRNCVEY
jgi:phosphatidylglycerophosphate synthase